MPPSRTSCGRRYGHFGGALLRADDSKKSVTAAWRPSTQCACAAQSMDDRSSFKIIKATCARCQACPASFTDRPSTALRRQPKKCADTEVRTRAYFRAATRPRKQVSGI